MSIHLPSHANLLKINRKNISKKKQIKMEFEKEENYKFNSICNKCLQAYQGIDESPVPTPIGECERRLREMITSTVMTEELKNAPKGDYEVVVRLSDELKSAFNFQNSSPGEHENKEVTDKNGNHVHHGNCENQPSKKSKDHFNLNLSVIKELLNSEKMDGITKSGDNESLLAISASAGQYNMVENLLKKGFDVDYNFDQRQNTPLMEAAINGHVEIVELLLKHKADVDKSLEDGNTALHFACSQNHLKVVEILLGAGARVDALNDQGYNPLMEAANVGSLEIVKLLLKKDPSLLENSANIAVCRRNDEDNSSSISFELKETPLTIACYKGHVEMVKFLLEQGKRYDIKEDELFSALMETAMDGHIEIARLLIEQGVHVGLCEQGYESPLSLAACGGHLELAKLLLENGAIIDDQNDEGVTALMEASREGHLDIVMELISRGANVNLKTEETNETAVTLAAGSGYFEVVKALVDAGADIEQGSTTALIEASSVGNMDIVKYLISIGANVNATSIVYETPLIMASEHGNIQVVEFLIQSGARVEMLTRQGQSALMKASKNGHLRIIEILVKNGADINRKTYENDQTVLSCACAQGHYKVVKYLLQNGADPNHLLKDNVTILMETCKGGHLLVAKLLLDPSLIWAEDCSDCSHSNSDPKSGSSSNSAKTSDSPSSKEHSHISLDSTFALSKALASMPGNKMIKTCPCCPNSHTCYRSSPVISECLSNTRRTVQSSSTTDTDCGIRTSSVGVKEVQKFGNAGSGGVKDRLQTSLLDFEANLHDGLVQTLANTGRLIDKSTFSHPITKSKTATTGRVSSSSTNQRKTAKPLPNNIVVEGSIPVQRSITIDMINSFTETNKDTALTFACLHEHFEMVMFLIKRGASLEHKDKRGYTPLMVTAVSGNIQIAKFLLDSGAPIDTMCEKNRETALTLACANDREELVRLLVERGAALEHTTLTEYTPLSVASNHGFVNIVRFLLQKGADANPNKHGLTPLMMACMSGHSDVVRLLLDYGADVNVENNKNTALTFSCYQGKPDIVAMLMEKKPNVEYRSKNGLTPLMEAASGGHTEIGFLLIKNGADVNAPPLQTSKETPLTLAAEKGHEKFIELLLKNKANIEFKNKRGCTALWLAASNGHAKCVELLDRYGACLDITDGRDVSALFASFRRGHINVVSYLVKKVTVFPSDNECSKYLNSIVEKESYNLVSSCCNMIMDAKEKQELEAQKVACDLIKEESEAKEKQNEKKAANLKKREKKKKRKAKAVATETVNNGSKPTKDDSGVSRNDSETMSYTKNQIPIAASNKNEVPSKPSKKASKALEKSTSTDEADNNGSDSDEWKQIVKRSSGQKNDAARKSARTFIPAQLVSRFIGKGGSSINSIREKTNTIIDIDTLNKTAKGDCPITIKGFPKDIRTVIAIIDSIVNDPTTPTPDILNKLDDPKKSSTLNSFKPIRDLRVSKPITTQHSSAAHPTTSRPYITALPSNPPPTISISDANTESKTMIYHPKGTRHDELEVKKTSLVKKEAIVPSVTAMIPPTSNVVWSSTVETIPPRPAPVIMPQAYIEPIVTTTSSVTYAQMNRQSYKATSLCPGAGRPPPTNKIDPQTFVCPIFEHLTATMNSAKNNPNHPNPANRPPGGKEVVFDKEEWKASSIASSPFPPSVFNILKNFQETLDNISKGGGTSLLDMPLPPPTSSQQNITNSMKSGNNINLSANNTQYWFEHDTTPTSNPQMTTNSQELVNNSNKT